MSELLEDLDLENSEPDVVEVDLCHVWHPSWKASSQVLAYKALLYQFKVARFEFDESLGYVCVCLYDDTEVSAEVLTERVLGAVEAVFDSAGRE